MQYISKTKLKIHNQLELLLQDVQMLLQNLQMLNEDVVRQIEGGGLSSQNIECNPYPKNINKEAFNGL